MSKISLEALSKRYGEFRALTDFSLEVASGEFVSLLGPSGSGKTTLLNLIAGMTRPSSGRILIDGLDVTHVPPSKRKLGMVFQNYALMPHMTVFENIAFPLEVRGVRRAEIRRRVGEVLDLIRMPHVAERRPKELSGGQQQRISLARCIVYKPALILMDEPLGALDKKLRQEMQIEISRLHRESGITMLYVTHDQEEALTMSDRIVLMKDGRAAQCGTADELYFEPNSPYVADFIGESNLMPGRIVSQQGSDLTLSLGDVRMTAPRPSFPVEVGEEITLLVRPELAALATAPSPTHPLAGALEASLVVGANVRHVVRLATGARFLVQEFNHRHREKLEIGVGVFVGWREQDARVLPPA
ncbi:ABC transporter ATP-binding protein [Methylobacterium sp. WSM2598]|uniref:ABC transporter ATP-binding protein n=1 Tax=Methylobacterium sp. WSM2598 TaxID=398261 RepID=UPI000378A107|nr:ABC transporter ATP-binding protein [Methylobacterium sp. WSM2598]